MSTLVTRDWTEIFYKEWGEGQPIVFSHGWARTAIWTLTTCATGKVLPFSTRLLPAAVSEKPKAGPGAGSAANPASSLERNTGFEPATFALARQPGKVRKAMQGQPTRRNHSSTTSVQSPQSVKPMQLAQRV
jgi:hypothetical protein